MIKTAAIANIVGFDCVRDAQPLVWLACRILDVARWWTNCVLAFRRYRLGIIIEQRLAGAA